jgi:hypothetical protein
MREQYAGSVPVADDRAQLAGIFTGRGAVENILPASWSGLHAQTTQSA